MPFDSTSIVTGIYLLLVNTNAQQFFFLIVKSLEILKYATDEMGELFIVNKKLSHIVLCGDGLMVCGTPCSEAVHAK